MSQFAFLQRQRPAVLDVAARTEAAVHADPRTASFQAARWPSEVDVRVEALREHAAVLEKGAVLVLDEARQRIRVLPLR